jgi:hypothetical protein
MPIIGEIIAMDRRGLLTRARACCPAGNPLACNWVAEALKHQPAPVPVDWAAWLKS